jgi:hypothetical protein
MVNYLEACENITKEKKNKQIKEGEGWGLCSIWNLAQNRKDITLVIIKITLHSSLLEVFKNNN